MSTTAHRGYLISRGMTGRYFITKGGDFIISAGSKDEAKAAIDQLLDD